MKNLIIDGQILQTDAWHRGMGKYTLQVLREINRTPAIDGIYLILNDALPWPKDRAETIEMLCPQLKITHVQLPLPDNPRSTSVIYKRQLSTHIAELIPNGTNYYLLTSLFFFSFYSEFPDNCRKLLLFYDLTPFLFWKQLGGYFPPDLYMGRFEKILEAELIYSISDTTRSDLVDNLGIDPNRIVNINGGFTKISESPTKPSSFDVPHAYILFPTGDLPHKNNETAVRGVQAYIEQYGSSIPLLITSNFSEASKSALSHISPSVRFTGNVSDSELEWLYENAEIVLFASNYEGLGLPILDAVASDKSVIASRIPVFEEMSKDAFYYFDPSDSDELARQIHTVLTSKHKATKKKQYSAILAKYTWENTCNAILTGLDTMQPSPSSPVTKPRIAITCIHPGISKQIGLLSEVLHAAMSQHFEIEYYFDANGYHYREMERPSFLEYFSNKQFDINDLTLDTYRKYDVVLYLIDEQTIPSRVAQRACVLPGIGIVAKSFSSAVADAQSELFKQLVLQNLIAIHEVVTQDFKTRTKLVDSLVVEVCETIQNPSAANRILHGIGFNNSIIRRLLALKNHEA